MKYLQIFLVHKANLKKFLMMSKNFRAFSDPTTMKQEINYKTKAKTINKFEHLKYTSK